jgi:hypothetical protein
MPVIECVLPVDHLPLAAAISRRRAKGCEELVSEPTGGGNHMFRVNLKPWAGESGEGRAAVNRLGDMGGRGESEASGSPLTRGIPSFKIV